MGDIATLRRDVRTYTTVALDQFDRLSNNDRARQALALIHDNRTARENPVRFEVISFFPSVFGWEDEVIITADLDRVEFVVPLKGYASAVPYNEVNIGRPGSVAQIGQFIEAIPPRFLQKQVQLLLDVFRKNPLTYDGKAFFATDHPHPLDASQTFDNIVSPNFADPAAPTDAEVQALLATVRARFTANLAIQSELIFGSEATSNLVVIAHSSGMWAALERVRTQPKVTIGTQQMDNADRNTFELALMTKPTGGQSDYVEFVMQNTGGARPAILVLDQDPVLDTWEENRFPEGHIAVGMKAIFGVKPGFPFTSIQARVT